jgi:hypothetical protein
MPDRIATGGSWDRHEPNVYFIASSPSYNETNGVIDFYDHMLFAVNELKTEGDEAFVRHLIDSGKTVFIDSGVFNLTNVHARAHGMTMDQVLSLPPDAIDGFDELFDKYVRIVREIGPRCWGYIEIDIGGRENKIKTRQRLHDLGLNPIPVYHPLNDGWDYFDYLAERYDRICFGNVVQADSQTRKRLVATAWERRRKYPDLWIHLLGLTPYEICNALPVNSCDSSTWISTVRWMQFSTRSALKAFCNVEQKFFRYDNEDETKAYSKTVQHSAVTCVADMRNWRNYINEIEEALECNHKMPL